jgi:hypothetical protein
LLRPWIQIFAHQNRQNWLDLMLSVRLFTIKENQILINFEK